MGNSSVNVWLCLQVVPKKFSGCQVVRLEKGFGGRNGRRMTKGRVHSFNVCLGGASRLTKV